MLKYKGGFVRRGSGNVSSRETEPTTKWTWTEFAGPSVVIFLLMFKRHKVFGLCLTLFAVVFICIFLLDLKYVPVRFCGSLSASLTTMSHKLDVYNNVKTSLSVCS